jgi:hypothetical protein
MRQKQTQQQAEILRDKATELWLQIYKSHGNTVSPEHEAEIKKYMDLYAQLVYGLAVGRYINDLPCGAGKTQTIVALILAMHELGIEDRGLVVTQFKISELCLLKLQLLKHGVPERKLGLIHGYKVNDTYPNADDGLPYTDGTYTKAMQDRAILPAINDDQSSDFQFLLMSHTKVKHHSREQEFFVYDAQPRVWIWDEEMLNTDATSIKLSVLSSAIFNFKQFHIDRGLKGLPLRMLQVFESGFQKIRQEQSMQVENHFSPRPVYLPPVESQEITLFKDFLKNEYHNIHHPKDKEVLKSFLKMQYGSLRVLTTGNHAVMKYDVVIPEEAGLVVVLDGSALIRDVLKADPRLKTWSDPVDIKDHSAIKFHTLHQSGSRYRATYTELGNLDLIPREVAIKIASFEPTDCVCIFTFKDKSDSMPKHIDHTALLKDVLEKELSPLGISLDETIMINGKTRKRFVFKTFGNHVGSNDVAYCNKIFALGMNERGTECTHASLIAQTGDPTKVFTYEQIKDAHTSELAHNLYQLSMRGCGRFMINGKSPAMDVFLVTNNKDIAPLLQKRMSGIKLVDWIPQAPELVEVEVLEEAVKAIAVGLQKITHGYTPEISVRTFRGSLPAIDCSDRTFTSALSVALLDQPQWKRKMKSLFNPAMFDEQVSTCTKQIQDVVNTSDEDSVSIAKMFKLEHFRTFSKDVQQKSLEVFLNANGKQWILKHRTLERIQKRKREYQKRDKTKPPSGGFSLPETNAVQTTSI